MVEEYLVQGYEATIRSEAKDIVTLVIVVLAFVASTVGPLLQK